ncbi:MAG: DUF711 family protein [Anaerolineales bacterium]|jgi:uncharacterized protein (UPF0210 family)
MKIRSITYFANPGWPIQTAIFKKASDFLAAARPVFESAGYEVDTTRMASIPFPKLLAECTPRSLTDLAQALESEASQAGFDYISLGPALPELQGSYAAIPQALAATQNAFFAGLMTRPNGGVALEAVRACARVIGDCAGISADGFGNLRFAALANVAPGAPFFPAAYAGQELPAFAIASEAADLAVQAFTQASSLQEAVESLVGSVEGHASKLQDAAQELARQSEVRFGGLDLTLAPFPEESRSLGTALERLGVTATGLHGSLAASAILTDALDRAQYRRAGFNGLMLPVLEDWTLARRAADGNLTIKDLLLYSTVCGTGLDTIPLPGDTSQEALTAVLLDLAALSQRLDKPLTARLMPIPGKQAGDLTDFNFPYFANSRVMALQADVLQGPLAGSEDFNLHPRVPN